MWRKGMASKTWNLFYVLLQCPRKEWPPASHTPYVWAPPAANFGNVTAGPVGVSWAETLLLIQSLVSGTETPAKKSHCQRCRKPDQWADKCPERACKSGLSSSSCTVRIAPTSINPGMQFHLFQEVAIWQQKWRIPSLTGVKIVVIGPSRTLLPSKWVVNVALPLRLCPQWQISACWCRILRFGCLAFQSNRPNNTTSLPHAFMDLIRGWCNPWLLIAFSLANCAMVPNIVTHLVYLAFAIPP